ncbi:MULTISPECIES: hypothetical protein [Exiguobacterium]|uniref:DUF1877 family protein n=2 Tax=Exiguobacterium artemiae TaxID=340145 RepID=B1YF47_EXIS2|nr:MULTISPECIES: hypothetical protein [Exiguobacterium]ACB62271.1 hypothetical protein Exig_2825 [Exiguobacterium sibiricum 255-15]MDW2886922.1 hypothetical protein [Exiguobacterium sibiricum]
MENVHYVRVADAVWDSFGDDPHIIMDWILFIHETQPDHEQLFALEETTPLYQLMSQIDIFIDQETHYNLGRAIVGEELIVNEEHAAIVGILPLPLLIISSEVMRNFDRQALEVIYQEAGRQGDFDEVWEQFGNLCAYFHQAEEAQDTILVYYV